MSDRLDAPSLHQDAVIYQLPRKAFRGSTGAGPGDVRSLPAMLDYADAPGVAPMGA